MKKGLILLFTGLTLLVFSKPPKNKTAPTSWVESTSIYGKWRWIETECCGKKRGKTTPDSYGNNIFLNINANNTFNEQSEKHRVPREGNITLSKLLKDGKTYKTIQFNDERPAHYELSKNGDTLVLSWEYLELQKETYVKAK